MAMDQDGVLGRKAVELGYLKQEQIEQAQLVADAEVLDGRPRRFLGKILVERGLLTFEQMMDLIRPGFSQRAAPPPPADDATAATLISSMPAAGASHAAAPFDDSASAATLISTLSASKPTTVDDSAIAATLISELPVTVTAAPARPAPVGPSAASGPERAEFNSMGTLIDFGPPQTPAPAARILPPPPDDGASHEETQIGEDLTPLPMPSLKPARKPEDTDAIEMSSVYLKGPAPAAPRPEDVTAATAVSPDALPPPKKTATRTIPSPAASVVPEASTPEAETIIHLGPLPGEGTHTPAADPSIARSGINLPGPSAAAPASGAVGEGMLAEPGIVRTSVTGATGSASTSAGQATQDGETMAGVIQKSTTGGTQRRTGGSSPPPGKGATFGRYELVKELARGAMGIVYIAMDPQLRRKVALKVMIMGDTPTGELSRRFKREALMAAKVRHTNIVQVYDVGEFEGKLYYTMELIEGDSLQGTLKAMKRIPPRMALKICRDAARALHAAHEASLVHRDIKPANIMLTSREKHRGEVQTSEDTMISIGDQKTSSFRVLVADFGIAKDVTSQTMMTRAGAVVGTPAYMSPEQAGEPDKIGPKSDIYSLGVVLYQILCGTTPFSDPDPIRLLAAVIQQDPPTLRKKAPELHPDLETIVMKSMEKDPARRYPTAGDFADDMDRYLSGEMIRAKPSSPVYRVWRSLVRHKAMFAPLVAAFLFSLGALGYFTVWPKVQDYYREQAAAAARRARENDAQARLGRALAAFDLHNYDVTVAELKELVGRYDAYARRGERVSIPEGHDLLARCYTEKNEFTQALLEHFRAYRSAIGVAGSDRYLLRTVRELVRQLRYDEATSLLNRIVRQTHDEEARAEAWYWMGRAAEGVMEFHDAVDSFDRAMASRSLPEELGDDCQEHRTFCAGLAVESPLPLPVTNLTAADIDGSSRKTLVGIGGNQVRFDTVREGGLVERTRLDGNQVYCGVVGPKGFIERGSIALETGDKFGLSALEVLPLPDAQHPTIVTAGGNAAARTGKLFLVRWMKDALKPIASTPLESPAGGFACGDLDGDGKPELLVGTGANERALRVYTWDEEAARLTLKLKMPVGGDVTRVETLDFDGDGKTEVIVFAGQWQTYGATIFQWDAAKQELAERNTAPLGVPMSIVRIERSGKLPLFVAGVGWDRQMVYPLLRVKGEQAFNESYRPPGAYVLEPLRDMTFQRKSLVSLDWSKGKQGRTGVVRLRGRAGDFLWCNVSYQGPLDPAPPRGLSGAIHVFKTDDDLRTFAVLLPRAGSSVKIGGPMWSLDLDEDGVDELVVASDRSLVYYDAWDRPSDVAHSDGKGAEKTAAAAPEEWVAKNPLLDFGSDAERVGLIEEALDAYTEAAQTTQRLTEVEEAAKGQMRCFMSLGKVHELAATAKDTAARFPPLEISVLTECVRLLDAGHQWGDAYRLAQRLLQSVDLTNEARERIGRESEVYREVSEMVQRVHLIGPNAAAVDWLATSPLAVVPGPNSSWRVYGASDSQDRFLVPFSNAAESSRLTGTIEVLRHEYGVGLRVGVGSFDPLSARGQTPLFPALSLAARGSKNYPMYTLDLESPHPASPRVERLGEQGEMWARALKFDLTLVAHQRSLLGRVENLTKAGGVDECELEALVPRADTILAGLELASGAGPGYWGLFQIDELELQSASDRVLPATYGPLTAIDHLMLANGRWIQGRTEEALSLYDRAIRLADREKSKEEEVRADGLPSIWDRTSPNDILSWVHVDARFYRGLLRYNLGDVKGATEDLDAAWDGSKKRVKDLIRRYAEPVHFRSKDMEALRGFWRRKAGNPEADKVPAWARQTFETMGADATEMLIEGLEVVTLTHPEIRAVGLDSPADRAGLGIGDAILKVDGNPVTTGKQLKEAILAAMKAGKDQAQLEVQRSGLIISVPVQAKDLGVEVQEVQSREIKIR